MFNLKKKNGIRYHSEFDIPPGELAIDVQVLPF